MAVYLDIPDYLSLMLAKLRLQKTGSIYTTQHVRVLSTLPSCFLSIIADRSLAESFVEKIRSILESLRLLRKPVVQEVYIMEDGAKVSKK